MGDGEGDILGGRQFGFSVKGWLKGLADKPVLVIPEKSLLNLDLEVLSLMCHRHPKILIARRELKM